MSSITRYVLWFLFFVSGASAIVYQVVWQRFLTFSFGSDTIASTWIVAIFMLGLGLGSWWGGILSDKLKSSQRIWSYVAIELLIGLFGLASPTILYEYLYQGLSMASFFWKGVACFVFILPPTVAMGMTLPLLSRWGSTDLQSTKRMTYGLYALNTLGASVGAFFPMFLIGTSYGFDGVVYFSAILNVLCAIGALLLSRTSIDTDEQISSASIEKSDILPFNPYVLFGISGFVTIGLEMIWFRLLSVMLKGNSYTFSILLFFYLAGIGIGTWLGVLLLQKIKRPIVVFVNCQLLIVVYVLGSLFLLGFGVYAWDFLADFRQHLLDYDLGAMNVKVLYLQLPMYLFGFPTVVMGISFVMLQEATHDTLAGFGKKLGKLLFFNILFASFSTIFTSFILINTFGTAGALRVLALVTLGWIISGYFLPNGLKPNLWGVFLSLVVTLCVCSIPSNEAFWRIWQGVKEKEAIIMEDKSCVSSIKLDPEGDLVFMNGLGQSFLPFDHDPIHLQLGLEPILLHPNPESICVIGFGSGATLNALSGHSLTKQIDCYEIAYNQFDLVESYGKLKKDSAILRLFHLPMVRFWKEDGRMGLLRKNQKYDIIEADALRPGAPYSGNIYSVEYFSLVKSRLKKGGFAVTWCPSMAIENSFRTVFPYVVRSKTALIGSNEPISIPSNLNERLALLVPGFKEDIASKIPFYGLKFEKLPAFIKKNAFPINRDLFPYDELCHFNFVK